MNARSSGKFETHGDFEGEDPTELDIEDLELLDDEGDVSGEAAEPTPERRSKWQGMELVRGEIEDFGPDLAVQFEMRKDLDKRPGDQPGEDMFLADRKTGLTGVLDGLGGEGSGDKASAAAAETMPSAYEAAKAELLKTQKSSREGFQKEFQAFLDGQVAFEHPSERNAKKKEILAKGWPPEVHLEAMALRKAVLAAHEAVKETKGLTTLTVGKTIELPDGRAFEVIVNSGDSGAFKIGEDGSVEELTKEDSVIDLLIANGMLTPEEAEDPNHKVAGRTVREYRAKMFQALGMDEGKVGAPFQPRVSVTELKPGEKIVYLSDGIRDLEKFQSEGRFDAGKAAEVLKAADGAENLASALVGDAARTERQLKDAWNAEQARAKIEGREPDLRLKPKEDEKSVLVKERLMQAEELQEEALELDESDIDDMLKNVG